MARHLIAGENEIKAGDQEGGERGPFLDRRAVGKARDQSEEGADNEKDHAGDDRHVITGDEALTSYYCFCMVFRHLLPRNALWKHTGS